MSLSIGARLGVYEILGTLGAGGMGEVYRARDTRLHREVALKILPETFARDRDRLARFEREAQVLASLNHPNIAQIYGLEESTGVPALVMEFVPGQTLEEVMRRLPSGTGLPLQQALGIARQIATALDAAHEAGIVHRDLKPANVKVRDDGTVKVLDFGLAKAVTATDQGSGPSSGSAPVDSPTYAASAMTQVGSVVGTAAYMAPEQARGRTVDKRADIWSFGVILFEMLTGQRLFAGDTVADTIAAVLTRDLDVTMLPADVPPHVLTLIQRCLDRDPKRRLRDIGEAEHQLDPSVSSSALRAPGATTPSQMSAAVVVRRRRVLLWVAGILAVVGISAGALRWERRQPTPEPASTSAPVAAPHAIAVLPFVNQSGNADDEYFSDGMTDELASALMKVQGLRVAARSSAFTFKGKNTDARVVGSALHVASVVEGTVRRAGSKLRVTVQLVNTTDGLAIWSDRYEREAKDVFSVQDDITGAIVSALQLTLSPASDARAHETRAVNPEAHDLYLRGRFLMLKQTEDSLHKALDYFQQAIAKAPDYAPPYAGISFAWAWLADAYIPPNEAEPKAKAAALKALALDPTSTEARTMLAMILWIYDWDGTASREEFRRALQADQNSMDAHVLYAITLCVSNRWSEGLAHAERAITLDPLNAWPSWTREQCLTHARRYDEAIAQHKKTEELDPNFFYLDSFVGIAYREKKMFAESAAEYERVRQVTGEPVAGLAVTYASMGRTTEAREILGQFLEKAKRRYVSPEQVATIYASLGDKDNAFVWLEKAYQARSAFLATSIMSAPYDPVRSDPRFRALLRKMNLYPRSDGRPWT